MKVAFYSCRERSRRKAALRRKDSRAGPRRARAVQRANALVPDARDATLVTPEISTRLA